MTIANEEKGTCPHCRTPNRFEGVQHYNREGYPVDFASFNLIDGADNEAILLRSCRCTQCGRVVLFLGERMIHPLGALRPVAPKEVPEKICDDFNEACLVESLSKKAAAALARRCLQNVLHDQEVSAKNLSEEIEEAMTKLPTHLSEAIDAIRNIGNFAAHPIKSKNTGEIVNVEEGETEWILDVLEQLFDFYYVQPVKTRAKKAALDAKLEDVGKPPMK